MKKPMKLVYGGMVGDPGKPLRHFVKDEYGNTVFVSGEFLIDYSGIGEVFKEIAKAYNASLDVKKR